MRLRLSLLAVLLFASPSAAESVSYRHDVWPILKRHCWGCHTGREPKGGLNLDTVASLMRGGESGRAIVAGKPDESPLLKMVIGTPPEMPPKQPPLSAEKVATLRQWIASGAPDDSSTAPVESVVSIPANYRFAPAVTSVSLSADGKLVAAACRSEVVLVDVDGDTPVRRWPTECDLVTHVEFSPDGRLLAASGGVPGKYGEVRFFDVATGNVTSSRRVGTDTLFRGNFAPDGQSLALGGADGAVHVIPVDAKAAVRRFELHSDWVLDAAFTADGKMVVSGGRDKATKVASVEAGTLLRALDSANDLIGAVAADGQFALSAGRARAVTGYEFKTALSGIEVGGSGNGARPNTKRDQYLKAVESLPGECFDLATSGDRKLLAAVGAFAELRLYRLSDRQRTALVANLPAPVYAVALNSDGTRAAIGSRSGLVNVYELPAGKLLKSLVPVPLLSAK